MKKVLQVLTASAVLLLFSCEKPKTTQTATLNDTLTVANIAERYLDAIGGRQAISQIHSVAFYALAEVDGQPLHLQITKTDKGQKTVLATNETGSQKIVWNGNSGYLVTQNGVQELSPWSQKELKNDSLLFPEVGFADNPNLKLVGIGEVKFEPSYKIVGRNTTYFYSVKTGLKTGEIMTHIIDGKETSVPTEFSNYKTIHGVKFPHAFIEKLGRKTIRYRIHKYDINTATDKDFQ